MLSNGHASMLLYSLLHLYGFDLPLEQLQAFRQLHSRTPGHPEYGDTPGVEVTTGPLGQGFAHGVGMALAARATRARFAGGNDGPGNHFVYAIVCAHAARAVSPLELELQAEVDKYVVCLLADGGAAAASPRWRRRLFEEFELEPDLDADERDRYRAANDGARRYAASLERRFVARGGTLDMLAELRRFYRLPLAQKLDHIAKAA